MDFNATIDLIIKDLRDASDIIDDLKKYPGVPLLQVELAKSKCKSAGEVIALLKTLKENPLFNEKEPPVTKKVQKQLPVEEPEPLHLKDIITPASEEMHEEVSFLEIESISEIEASEPEKVQNKEKESTILADTFSHLSPTFNEQLGTIKGDTDIAEILNTKPITSLIEAIGLNDKFLFMSEIFKGNKSDYNQAISRLENVENLTDARAIIMSYTGDNTEIDAVKQLLDLVRRKLPSNE